MSFPSQCKLTLYNSFETSMKKGEERKEIIIDISHSQIQAITARN